MSRNWQMCLLLSISAEVESDLGYKTACATFIESDQICAPRLLKQLLM